MLRVYLSGPMQFCDDEQSFGWRRRVTAALAGVMHVFTPEIEMPRSAEETAFMVEQDKRDIDVSEFVLVNPWKFSAGTAMEQIYAWERGKTVVLITGTGETISPWHRYHAHYVLHDEASAVEVLKSMAWERRWSS